MDAHWVRSARDRSRVGGFWAAIAIAFAVVFAFLSLPGGGVQPTPDWMLLAVLALIAEMIPAREGFGNAPLRFTLPFIVAVCVGFGPTAAWLTDTTVVLAVAVAGGTMNAGRFDARTTVTKLVVCSIAATLAGALYGAAAARFADPDLRLMASVVAYVVGYMSVTRIADLRLGSRFDASEVRPGVVVATIFICLSFAAAVFVANGAAVFAPAILGPILAIRAMLRARSRIAETTDHTVSTLALMLQRSHPYTHRHLERVAEVSEAVALRLGLAPRRARMVQRAAILHDIGKIAIDEDILDLPRKLTDEEYEHVKLHAEYGGQILAEVESMREVSRWIRHHHERPDGRGYPEGLLDPEIPLESKIIAAVDAFDAMTGGMEGRDGRPFRAPMPVDEALDELERCAGSQFDPHVVRAFREVVGGAL